MKELLQNIGKVLTEQQIKNTAIDFEVPYAAVKAVVLTEARSEGFYAGTLIPIVRFENHIFDKRTKGKYRDTHPHLSSSTFTNKYNKVGIPEFYRFLEAYKLDTDAAIWSTSWGLGQIMGFNYNLVKCASLKQFMEIMFMSEYDQLMLMMQFIKNNNLLDYMKKQQWDKFALSYNGKDYKMNKYDEKLAKYFKQYS